MFKSANVPKLRITVLLLLYIISTDNSKAQNKEQDSASKNIISSQLYTNKILLNKDSEEAKQVNEDDKKVFNNVDLQFGAEFVSRYVWRGIDIGDTPNIQPTISFIYGGLELGMWASYPLSVLSSSNNEQDLFLSYTYDADGSNYSVILTDYYFPNAGLKFQNWDGNGNGAHTVEIAASYSSPIDNSVNLFAAYNIYNDTDNSFYLEAGYSVSLRNIPINFSVGGAKGKSSWHGINTKRFELTNLGVKTSKEVQVSKNLLISVSASYIINFYVGKSYLVFGIGI